MLSLFRSLDIYGHAISVHYRGEGTHKTSLGAFMSLATFILGLINLYNLIVQFVDKSAQKESYTKINVDSLEI